MMGRSAWRASGRTSGAPTSARAPGAPASASRASASRPASGRSVSTRASENPASVRTSGDGASTRASGEAASGGMKTMYGGMMTGRSAWRASGAGPVSSGRRRSGGLTVSGLVAALSLPSPASATIASGLADWTMSAAASRETRIPVWSHPLSARPNPTDAGTTNSRAVRLRKPSMSCRTSRSFMAWQQCTPIRTCSKALLQASATVLRVLYSGRASSARNIRRNPGGTYLATADIQPSGRPEGGCGWQWGKGPAG